jgi:Cys-tRNA(Pro)/Cys-tRNA(Cys) deacylase
MRTPAQLLDAAGVAYTIHEHVPVSTVDEILAALPFPAEQHVKTLAVDAGGTTVLAALRGSDRLGFGKLARAVGVARDRIAPLSSERVRAELGLEPGGVCPLVEDGTARVLVDAAVLELPRAFCGAGRNDATLELAPADLAAAAGAEIADLAAERDA